MLVTTTSITAVSVSTRSDQSTLRSPDVNQLIRLTCASWPKPTRTNAIQDRIIEMKRSDVVISSAARAPAAAGSAG